MSGHVRTPSMIAAPRLLAQRQESDDGLECSVHTLPKPLLREFRHVFGDKYLSPAEDRGIGLDSNSSKLLAIPTNQRSRKDLVAVGDHVEQEKDRLLNVVSFPYV